MYDFSRRNVSGAGPRRQERERNVSEKIRKPLYRTAWQHMGDCSHGPCHKSDRLRRDSIPPAVPHYVQPFFPERPQKLGSCPCSSRRHSRRSYCFSYSLHSRCRIGTLVAKSRWAQLEGRVSSLEVYGKTSIGTADNAPGSRGKHSSTLSPTRRIDRR